MSPPRRVGEALAAAAAALRRRGVAEARLSAELLLAEDLGVRRLDLRLDPDRALTADQAAALERRTARRAAHEPVQYILGEAPFRDLLLRVGPGVLVPRPETECLVEEVVLRLRSRPALAPRVLDVGTGSGAIALALLLELRGATAVATDVSAAALACAAANAESHGLAGRLDLRRGDLLDPLLPGETFDVVVANLPYVAEGEIATLPREVRSFEPREALLGGRTGLEVIARLVAAAPGALRPGGLLACEAAPHQTGRLRRIVEGTPGLRYIAAFPDLAGRSRGFLAEASAARP